MDKSDLTKALDAALASEIAALFHIMCVSSANDAAAATERFSVGLAKTVKAYDAAAKIIAGHKA
jgi:hypothetical protein